jgi:hypothetical protein
VPTGVLDLTGMGPGEVVDAVGLLVAAGEYRDELLLRPGADAEGTEGFLRTAKGDQAIVPRGSPEHERARAAGDFDPLPPLVPAQPRDVDEAEAELGCRIPEPLRSLYLEVGNGGFGPGSGVLGLRGGHHDDEGATALDLLADPGLHAAPATLWPLCYWGCAIYSFVDCRSAEATVWGFDPNPEGAIPEALFPQEITLTAWFDCWIGHSLYQPVLVHDPETGRLRAATDAELEASFDDDGW